MKLAAACEEKSKLRQELEHDAKWRINQLCAEAENMKFQISQLQSDAEKVRIWNWLATEAAETAYQNTIASERERVNRMQMDYEGKLKDALESIHNVTSESASKTEMIKRDSNRRV